MINSNLSGKANSSHNHDDRYFTESEMNAKLNAKANIIKFSVSCTPTFNKTYVNTNDSSIWVRQWGAVAHIHFYIKLTSSVSKNYTQYKLATGCPPALYSAQTGASCIDGEKADCYFIIGNEGELFLEARFTNMASKIIIGSITYIAKTALYN